MTEPLSPARKEEIRGMAETLQWGRDWDAAEAMQDLLREIDRLTQERDEAQFRAEEAERNMYDANERITRQAALPDGQSIADLTDKALLDAGFRLLGLTPDQREQVTARIAAKVRDAYAQRPPPSLITENTSMGELEDLLANHSAAIGEPLELRLTTDGTRWRATLWVWDKPTPSGEHGTLAEAANKVAPAPSEKST